MKRIQGFLRLCMTIILVFPFVLEAQVQTLDEFKSDLENHWDIRDTKFETYAREELMKFLTDRCREGDSPLDLLKAMKTSLFTKEAALEYRELFVSLDKFETSALEIDNRIKSFVDKYFKKSQITSLIVAGVTYYIYRNQCSNIGFHIDSNPILNSISPNQSIPSVNDKKNLRPKLGQDYIVLDFIRETSGDLNLEDHKFSNGSILQMATIMPPGLTITMELSGLVVTMYPVEQFVKIAGEVK